MIKRFLVGMIAALLILGLYDYVKHRIVASQLMNVPHIKMNPPSFHINRRGFYLKIQDIMYQGIHIDNVRIHIPFFSHKQFYAWGNDLEKDGFSSHRIKAIGHIADHVKIDYFYLKDNRLRLLDGLFTNRDITGHAVCAAEKVDFTFHGTMVNEGPHDLFTFTCFGSIEQPKSPLRKGTIQIKVSHVDNLLTLITRGDNSPLSAWQRDFFTQTFGDNVVIPLDVRGNKIYLGPLKIFEFSQEFPLPPLPPIPLDNNPPLDALHESSHSPS